MVFVSPSLITLFLNVSPSPISVSCSLSLASRLSSRKLDRRYEQLCFRLCPPLIESVFFTTAALTNGFCFVTMGYAQLVIGRTMNVVNLDRAAEIFNYPVAMKSDWDSSIRKCQHSPWSWCCVKIARLNLFHTSTTVDLW
ncbi:unnamed protein product [Brassica oleracea var. botrytis]